MPFNNFRYWRQILWTMVGLVTMTPVFSLAESNLVDPLTCYEESATNCYEPIKNRGRTLIGVYKTENYKPFMQIDSAESFRSAWRNTPFYIFANLAHAAYLDEAEIIAMIDGFGGRAQVFQDRGRFGYLAVFEEMAILVFRGSDDPRDMLDNLHANPQPFKGETVHAGFRDAAVSLWRSADIEKQLSNLPKGVLESGEIYVTGHSLGGAMAVISGFLYAFKQVVTFGEPRVLTQSGVSLGETALHTRVVNGNDNVTMVPPKALGFRDHGNVVKIRDLKQISKPWSLTVINMDHSISNYAYNLWRLRK